MNLHVNGLAKLLPTRGALIRIFSAVLARVSLEIARTAETLLTHVTLERSLSGVDKSVFLQMRQLGKPFRALVTPEWSLAGVNTKMDFQVGQLREHFLALATIVHGLSGFFEQRVGERAMSANAPRTFGRCRSRGVFIIIVIIRFHLRCSRLGGCVDVLGFFDYFFFFFSGKSFRLVDQILERRVLLLFSLRRFYW